MVGLFNHTLDIVREQSNEDPTLETLLVTLHYDDAFNVRQSTTIAFRGDVVDHVRVGGTACTYMENHPGKVIHVVDGQILVLSQAKVLTMVPLADEKLYIGDDVTVFEHMSHSPGELNKFDFLVTKRQADFRLNSIRIVGLDQHDKEVDVVYIDPYTGQVNHDGRHAMDTTY